MLQTLFLWNGRCYCLFRRQSADHKANVIANNALCKLSCLVVSSLFAAAAAGDLLAIGFKPCREKRNLQTSHIHRHIHSHGQSNKVCVCPFVRRWPYWVTASDVSSPTKLLLLLPLRANGFWDLRSATMTDVKDDDDDDDAEPEDRGKDYYITVTRRLLLPLLPLLPYSNPTTETRGASNSGRV